MLDRFILVPYEIKGQKGQIIVKEDVSTEEMKKGCIQDYIENNYNEYEIVIKFD